MSLSDIVFARAVIIGQAAKSNLPECSEDVLQWNY